MSLPRKTMTIEIARLEWKLLHRNRASRFLVLAGPAVVTALAIIMLGYPGPDEDIADVIFVSCLFTPITYASLAFSWNATNWGGLFQVPVDSLDHLRGRLLSVTALAVPPMLAIAGGAAWLRPGLAGLPVSAGLFGITVVSIPFLLVSARTPRWVDAHAPPFADARKFGWKHWVAGLVVVMPGIVLLRVLPLEQFVAVLGVTAVAALAALPLTVQAASRVLDRMLPELSDRLLDA
jgi:hypothetical protein